MLKRPSIKELPKPLDQLAIVDHRLVPRYWGTVWSILTLNDVAPSTRVKRLRYLDSLYEHADSQFGLGALDDALGNVNKSLLAQILETWFITIVNRPVRVASDAARWQTGLEFATFISNWQSKTQGVEISLKAVEASARHLLHLYKGLRVHAPRQSVAIRSLPVSVVEALYRYLDPESIDNPFDRKRTKWLVYTSFILMLHQGLRRGEVLLLPVDAVKSGFDARRREERYWLNVQFNPYEDENEDPRFTKPSIKTAQSIRQIPVSKAVANIVQTYVENYRGKANHSYLMNSQINRPLSTEALTKYFSKVSEKLPIEVRKELSNRTGHSTISPHDFRHTCAVIRLNQMLSQGDHMDEASQKLRAFFGWSRTSTMPMKYAASVFDDRLASVWSDHFDSQVALLRSIS